MIERTATRTGYLWLIPFAYLVVSFILGGTIPRIEYHLLPELHSGISVGSAQAFFSSITSGMMALTGILFSIAFVIAQFSSSAYSPRLTLVFSRDPTVLHALGLFIATFMYSLATLIWVDRDGSGRVPVIATGGVIVLLAASMVALAFLILRLNRLKISYVLAFVGDEGRKVIRAVYPDKYAQEDLVAAEALRKAAEPALPGVTQVVRYAGVPLYIANVDVERLVSRALDARAIFVFDAAVGDVLTDHAVVLRVHGATTNLSEGEVLACVHVGVERTFEQDPKYAIRLLVDIAIKALSAAINDPTTAVQALDQIEDLLSRLGRRILSPGRFTDNQGDVRVILPMPTWDDLLSLSFDEIRIYGVASIQVTRRMRSALVSLGETVAEGPRRDALQRYLRHLDAATTASAYDAEDRATALSVDKQGLGVSRSEA